MTRTSPRHFPPFPAHCSPPVAIIANDRQHCLARQHRQQRRQAQEPRGKLRKSKSIRFTMGDSSSNHIYSSHIVARALNDHHESTRRESAEYGATVSPFALPSLYDSDQATHHPSPPSPLKTHGPPFACALRAQRLPNRLPRWLNDNHPLWTPTHSCPMRLKWCLAATTPPPVVPPTKRSPLASTTPIATILVCDMLVTPPLDATSSPPTAHVSYAKRLNHPCRLQWSSTTQITRRRPRNTPRRPQSVQSAHHLDITWCRL